MNQNYDYFSQTADLRYAGKHLLLDLWQCSPALLQNPCAIERSLRQAAADCGASVLHAHLHHFHSSGGVTGVLLLAESHISIHTWPEHDFAAIDVFMCGECDPDLAVPRIRADFAPARLEMHSQRRGLLPIAGAAS
jgi:S-adenosylmethionine decarboxylase